MHGHVPGNAPTHVLKHVLVRDVWPALLTYPGGLLPVLGPGPRAVLPEEGEDEVILLLGVDAGEATAQ